MLAISVDAADKHKSWVGDINETQKTTVAYPIVAGGLICLLNHFLILMYLLQQTLIERFPFSMVCWTKLTWRRPLVCDSIFSLCLQLTSASQGLPQTVRSVFLIDPNRTVRLIITYPASCGRFVDSERMSGQLSHRCNLLLTSSRNFDEIIRVLDSLQLTDKNKVHYTTQHTLAPLNNIPHPRLLHLPTGRREKMSSSLPVLTM